MKQFPIFILLLIIPLGLKSQHYKFDWATQFGGNKDDYSRVSTYDNMGNVYAAGSFSDTVFYTSMFGPKMLLSYKNTDDIFVLKTNSNGKIVWAKSLGGDGKSDVAYGITTDKNGCIYVTGLFSDTVDFDPDTGKFIATSYGKEDAFILKLDSEGKFIWVKTFGGKNDDEGHSIIVDNKGYIYLFSTFEDSVDFNTDSSGSDYKFSKGDVDICISKYANNGAFIWAKSFGGKSTDAGISFTKDQKENLVISGWFNDSVDFDPGIGYQSRVSAGGEDIFILKLDSHGNFIWVKTLQGKGRDLGYTVTTDNYDNIYSSGFFMNTVQDDVVPSINIKSNGGWDIFILKLDENGNTVWLKAEGGNSEDRGLSIKCDSSGNIVLTGFFNKTVDFDPGNDTMLLTSYGNEDAYLQMLDSSGNLLWVKQIGGPEKEYGRYLDISRQQEIYLAGWFKKKVDFNTGTDTFYMNSLNSLNIYITKFSLCTPVKVYLSKTSNTSYTLNNKTYSQTGVYYQRYNSSYGCDSIIILNFTLKTGIENKIENEFSIYPNPNRGIFNIDAGDAERTIYTIKITDVNGKSLYYNKEPYTSKKEVEFKAPDGIYLLEITDRKGVIHHSKLTVINAE